MSSTIRLWTFERAGVSKWLIKPGLSQVGGLQTTVLVFDVKHDWFVVARKNLASSAVENLVQMMESRLEIRKRLDGIEQEIQQLPLDSNDSAERRADLLEQQETVSMSLARIEARIKKAALDLQISDPHVAAQLRASQQNKFLDLKLRARALKQRLRQRLISRRFEQERLERAYRSARLGKFELLVSRNS
jgi:hypothetical protein